VLGYLPAIGSYLFTLTGKCTLGADSQKSRAIRLPVDVNDSVDQWIKINIVARGIAERAFPLKPRTDTYFLQETTQIDTLFSQIQVRKQRLRITWGWEQLLPYTGFCIGCSPTGHVSGIFQSPNVSVSVALKLPRRRSIAVCILGASLSIMLWNSL